ncbi:TetR/AcrR family transcriptional regulator [Elizabethkingia anophelis]|uniref:TetR/AcrR family transcriptional regulator n=1 Tax=Elizabethkingia anophelis TaxID=1117645 RepID=UPI00136D1DE5|nr:TetR/AcrR family transcriptional regulator [Elizabethkingia anophelis]MYY43922.1 TetR/AcrR family transcriptional regulator [Elizabethkingia anophelis]
MLKTPRERLLDTASKLFHNQGYNNTGINQIISESKVSKASFYDYFKSKEGLCMAFLEKRYEYWVSKWDQYISTASSQNEKILKSFDFLIYMNERENFRGGSFFNISSEIPDDKVQIHETICKYKNQVKKKFTSEIRDKILADNIYLLFETSIVMSRIYRSNELIIKSKIIIEGLLKN